MILFLLACARPAPDINTDATLAMDDHSIAERSALSRVPDPERNGPPIAHSAAPLPPFLGVDRSRATYMGSQACSDCHPGPFQQWKQSAHATAMHTLQAESQAHDPSCLRCHFTGFQHPGAPMVTHLAEVGCESCHGPASMHLAQPSQPYGQLPADGSACVACHTIDNSPDFDWTSYWEQIQH